MADEKKNEEKGETNPVTNNIYLCFNGPPSMPNTHLITLPTLISNQAPIPTTFTEARNSRYVPPLPVPGHQPPNMNVLQPNINAVNQIFGQHGITFRMNAANPTDIAFQILPVQPPANQPQQQQTDVQEITEEMNRMYLMLVEVDFDVAQININECSRYPNLAHLTATMGSYYNKNNKNKNKKKLLANLLQTNKIYKNNKNKKKKNCVQCLAIFQGVKCSFSHIIPPNIKPQSHPLWKLMVLYGATPVERLTKDCTHLIGSRNVITTSPNKLFLVHFKWVVDSIKTSKKCDERLYLIDGSKYSYNYILPTPKQVSNDKTNHTNDDIDVMMSTCPSNDSISKANKQFKSSLPNLQNNDNNKSNKFNGKYNKPSNKPPNNSKRAIPSSSRRSIQSPTHAQINNNNKKNNKNESVSHRKMRMSKGYTNMESKNNNNINPSKSQSKSAGLRYIAHAQRWRDKLMKPPPPLQQFRCTPPQSSPIGDSIPAIPNCFARPAPLHHPNNNNNNMLNRTTPPIVQQYKPSTSNSTNSNYNCESASHLQNTKKNKKRKKCKINPTSYDDECDPYEPIIKKRRLNTKCINNNENVPIRRKRKKKRAIQNTEKFDMKYNNNNNNNNNSNSNNRGIPPLLPPQNNGHHATSNTTNSPSYLSNNEKEKDKSTQREVSIAGTECIAYKINGKWKVFRTDQEKKQQRQRVRMEDRMSPQQIDELNNGKRMNKIVKIKKPAQNKNKIVKINPNHFYVWKWVDGKMCLICEKEFTALQKHERGHVWSYQGRTTSGQKIPVLKNEYDYVTKELQDGSITITGIKCKIKGCKHEPFTNANIDTAIRSCARHQNLKHKRKK